MIQKQTETHRITIIGTGFVGLTSGACFADLGHDVLCIDNDEDKINALNRGVIPIYEPGLAELIRKVCTAGRLAFSSDMSTRIGESDFVFLCLPTPSLPSGEVNLDYVTDAVAELQKYLSPRTVVVTKSTVPIGSAALIRKAIKDSSIEIASNPEFLREGSAVSDFFNPDRIIIGAFDEGVAEKVASLFEGLSSPVVITDTTTAELVKYLSNSYLALRLSFVNEVADLCQTIGSDVLGVLHALSLDTRIGSSFFSPGPGWGGSCLPKDTRAITSLSRRIGSPLRTIEAAILSNQMHAQFILDQIGALLETENGKQSRIAVLGLTFKANTSDIRDSQSIALIRSLANQYPTVVHYDPVASAPHDLPSLQAASLNDAINGADLVVVATDWDEFRNTDPSVFRQLMKGRVLLDLRYTLNVASFASVGLRVTSLGRLPQKYSDWKRQ